jgi:TM2 domain-containing membrane protein YozV
MPFCNNCGKEISDQAIACPSCGHPQKNVPEFSSKSGTETFLLCFFFGGLGIHRFYVGKVVTALLMLFTLGGLGIWTIVDLIIIAVGGFRDAEGFKVKVGKGLAIVIFIFLFLFIILIILIVAITIPHYARYRQAAIESAVQSAYHSIALAEEEYYSEYRQYTDNYTELTTKTGIVQDPNIDYSVLKVYFDNQDCYKFLVKHKTKTSSTYLYDSCGTPLVKSYKN